MFSLSYTENKLKDKPFFTIGKEGSIQTGLGLLAKYASNALKQHMTTKKIKRKREGSCSEQTADSQPNEEECTPTNDTNENISTNTIASSPQLEGSY